MSSKQVWRNATADSGAELYSFYLVVGTMVRWYDGTHYKLKYFLDWSVKFVSAVLSSWPGHSRKLFSFLSPLSNLLITIFGWNYTFL